MARTKTGNPKIAIGYLRVSTTRQELGPEAQRASIEAWATREGATVVSWHVDAGISGAAPIESRPGLLAALGALRTHGAGVLVVAKRDRLARDPVVAGLTERAALKSGAVVASADGTGNGTTPADQFMRSMIDAAAQYERSLIRARTKAALAVKRARGEKLGGHVPFGYCLGADGKALEPHADEQAIVAQVRALRAEGVSLRSIVARLAELGVTSRVGKPLALTQVARIAA